MKNVCSTARANSAAARISMELGFIRVLIHKQTTCQLQKLQELAHQAGCQGYYETPSAQATVVVAPLTASLARQAPSGALRLPTWPSRAAKPVRCILKKAMADSTLEGEKPVAGAPLTIHADEAVVTSAWVTLQHELFRVLWIASVASNIGTMMQDVGASWLMTQLAPSPLMVALIQTAGALPVFLLSFAAGALADIVDRRRLLIFSQSWMLGAAAGLGILTVFHLTSPLILLTFTFLLGFGNALNGPAWQAIVPELVPRAEVGAAVSHQLGRLQCGASRGSGAGRTGGSRRRFRGRLSAQRRFVPGRHRGVLPLAPQAPQERAAGGARGGSHAGRMALRGPRSLHPLHAGPRVPVHARGERLLGPGAALCPPEPGARGSRLRRPARIFRIGRGARRIDSAAPAAATGHQASAELHHPAQCGRARC